MVLSIRELKFTFHKLTESVSAFSKTIFQDFYQIAFRRKIKKSYSYIRVPVLK